VQEYDPSTGTFKESISIFGEAAGGRFGSAVSALGDLDYDGKGDFAVGSPYEDDGAGAVRIFFGKVDVESIQGGRTRSFLFACE